MGNKYTGLGWYRATYLYPILDLTVALWCTQAGTTIPALSPTSYYTNDDGYCLFWSSSSTRQLIHTLLTERHPAVAETLALFLSKIRLN